jgi:hypothetical protein
MASGSMNSKTFGGEPDQYFATLPVEDLLTECERRVNDYQDYALRTGKLTTWRTNWEMWMRSEMKIGIRFGGDRGQYNLIESNIYRSIVTGLVSTIANQRPSFQPEAINDDHKSMSQDIIFDSVSNYYLKVKHLEDSYKLGLTYGLVTGEGWLFEKWNADIGETVDVVTDPTGKQVPVKEGDAQFAVLGPMDVIRDYTRMDTNNDWYIVREYLNKWDLIAQRPDLMDELKGYSMPTTLQRFRFGHIVDAQTSNSDLIPVYTFIHRKTAACPDGRITQYIDADTWVLDTALPYDEIPLYPMMPDQTLFNNFGSTVMTSLVKLQYAYDKTLSVIVTNQQAFAITNIVIDESTQTKPEQVIEGLNFIKTNMKNGVPMGLELCKTPAEIFKFLELLESQMEKLSGLPSILRGQPPTGVESGTAMAFLQAQALVFNSPIQQAYISFLERSATGLFNILKSFANTKRMITIAGSSKSAYMGEFSGQDLSNISRVIVSAGNPATRSEAGKLQIAQDLMAKGLIKDANQYFEVLATGQLDPMTEGPEAENMLIIKENEQLRRSLPQVAAPWDNHANHIQQHFVIMMDPALRQKQNDPVMAATMQHIMAHAGFLFPGIQNPTDPRLMALMGNNVQGMPAGAPAPEQPTPGPVSNPLPAGAAQVANNTPPLMQERAGLKAPHAPILPRATPAPVAAAAAQMGNAAPPKK